jgi:hypothetical protein
VGASFLVPTQAWGPSVAPLVAPLRNVSERDAHDREAELTPLVLGSHPRAFDAAEHGTDLRDRDADVEVAVLDVEE